jgi:hypothetical protein
MKKIITLFFAMALLLAVTECAKKTTVPPGQAKKIFGTQSAAPFAPGQQKKQGTPSKSQNAGKTKKN